MKNSALLFSLIFLGFAQAKASVITNCDVQGIDAQIELNVGTEFEDIDGVLVKAVRSSLTVSKKQIRAMKKICNSGTRITCYHLGDDGVRYGVYPQINMAGEVEKMGLIVWNGDQPTPYDSAVCNLVSKSEEAN